MRTDRKKPSTKPDAKRDDRKKKSTPLEPEPDEVKKEYDSPFPHPDPEGEDSNAQRGPDRAPSDYM